MVVPAPTGDVEVFNDEPPAPLPNATTEVPDALPITIPDPPIGTVPATTDVPITDTPELTVAT